MTTWCPPTEAILAMPVSPPKVPLEIVARHLSIPEPVRTRIERLAAKLQTFDPALLGCRVVVDSPQRFATGSAVEYRVGLRLTLPGVDVVVDRQRGPDLDAAIQAAFAAAGRRLQDAARLRRGDVKRRSPPTTGEGSRD